MSGIRKYNPSPNTFPVTAVNLRCTPRYPAAMVPNGESTKRSSSTMIAAAIKITFLPDGRPRVKSMVSNLSAITLLNRTDFREE